MSTQKQQSMRYRWTIWLGAGLIATICLLGPLHPQSPSWSDKLQQTKSEAVWKTYREGFKLSSGLHLRHLGCPTVVVEAAEEVNRKIAQIEAGDFPELVKEVQLAVRMSWNARASDSVFLTRNTTEGCRVLALGLGLKRDDELIVSDWEHATALHPFRGMEASPGVRIVTHELSFGKQESTETLLNLLESALRDRVRAAGETRRTFVVLVSHVSYRTGHVLPVAELGQRIAELRKTLRPGQEIFYIVDGAQAWGMIPIDVKKIGCHAYVASGHKFVMALPAIGALLVTDQALRRLNHPLLAGGTGYYNAGGGTRPISQIAALGKALEVIKAIGQERLTARMLDLRERMRRQLAEVEGLSEVSSSAENVRSAVLVYEVERLIVDGSILVDDRVLVEQLAAHNPPVHAKPMTPDWGKSHIRFNIPPYLNEQEVDRTTRIIAAVLKKARAK